MFEKASEKVLTDNEVDIDSTLLAANKVTDFLDENLEKPFERYMVARLVSILYEETKDYSLEPEFESKLRQLARQKPKKSNGD
ncbi:hypothetical protein JW988_08430 [Candidatus Bathyarchaeota archaeon]|nr:hypothetical protein [Candidatus Bathyarchaeota archaeon]